MEITLKNKQVIRGILVTESETEIRLFDVLSQRMAIVNRVEIAALFMIRFTQAGV